MAVVGAPCDSCGKMSPDPDLGGRGDRCRNSDHLWKVKCSICGHSWLWVYGDRCAKFECHQKSERKHGTE